MNMSLPCAIALALSMATGVMAPNAHAQQVAADAKTIAPEQIAAQFLDHLDAGRYADAEAMLDDTMRAAVPASALEGVWKSMPAATTRVDTKVIPSNGMQVIVQSLVRGDTRWLTQTAIAADGRIAGFRITPEQTQAPIPALPADANFTETDVQMGKGERGLPATLWMPNGKGPFPGVVLVHGSGPNDRHETIGPNRVFLDIARGLAAQGIAVLSYDKRTKARPQDFADGVTIDSETTDDAVAAIAQLQKTPGIDAKRVFVLGHSQGGMMAPRIVQRAKTTAGMILFAAPARKLLDILIEQNVRLAVLDDGKTSTEEAAAISKLRAQVQAARNDPDAKAADLPLGQSAAYWRSVDAVDPVTEAVKTTVPILFLQGARDIQVVDADWQRWKASFDGDKKAQFKLYESLNHLGIAGEGEGSLQEYQTPGHVDATLINDIGAWIKAQQ